MGSEAVISLKDLKKGKCAAPPRIVLYGTPGIGKSTFANAAGAVFVSTEDGLTGIDVEAGAFPVAKSYQDIMEAMQVLATEDHNFHTVCIDSIDGIEMLLWSELCARSNVNSIERIDKGYGKGYVMAAETFSREILAGLNHLRDEKGMAVILICHHKIKRYDDPAGEAYDRYQLKLQDRLSELVVQWADVVAFANYEVHTRKSGDDKAEKHKGIGSGRRLLYLEERPTHIAKNRYGLPHQIDFTWEAFNRALNGGNEE